MAGPGPPAGADASGRGLGDVAWYLAKAATALDLPLEEIFQANIDQMRQRYPKGFNCGRSQTRLERDL
ncbi:hypothetical protein [Acutalibacter intestini]|uniref:hypothetical protein n=1 Tax=Acutalibacter intestini TaxID=3093659 RepID=UPI002AC92E8E|nr:hypothetical protein [Acutalibacter sp. M00204]